MVSSLLVTALWALLVVAIGGAILARCAASHHPMNSWRDILKERSSHQEGENAGDTQEALTLQEVSLMDLLEGSAQEGSGYVRPSSLPGYSRLESLMSHRTHSGGQSGRK